MIIDCKQLRALLWKISIQKRRRKCSTICDYIFAFLFTFKYLLWKEMPLENQLSVYNSSYGLVFLFYILSAKFMMYFMQEKETKLTETLLVMGMSRGSYILSWIISEFISFFTVMLVALTFCSFDQVFFAPWLPTFAASLILPILHHLSFALMLTACFGKVKTTMQVVAPIFMIPGIFFIIGRSYSPGLIYLLSYFPQFGGIVFQHQGAYNAFSSYNVLHDYGISLVTQSILIILYTCFNLALYFYLEEVLPSRYGVKKHACWLCRKVCHKQKPKYKAMDQEIEMPSQTKDRFRPILEEEDVTQEEGHILVNQFARYEEKVHKYNQRIAVKISDLNKQFGSLEALKHFNLQIYEDQVFCFLGHNGAGKTTLLNILTGIYQKSSGKVKVFEEDIDQGMSGIKREIGLCNQDNVHIPELRVHQHLELMCLLKHMPKDRIDLEITQIAASVGLLNERQKIPKQLSGGMKRKLSIAIALVGGSRFILMDEPTSAVDPSAREEIWKVIERNKQNRCIVLTTQHLREADTLSDRIGILSHGELLCLGSSNYIKRTFGVGYHLTVSSCQGNQIPDPNYLLERVRDYIPRADLDRENKDQQSIKLFLPFENQNDYFAVVTDLERDFIVDLEISSLQEAFINISEKIENRPHKIYNLPNSFHDAISLNSCSQIAAIWKVNLLNMSKSAGRIFHLLVPSIVTLFILSVASIVMKNYMPHQRSLLQTKQILMNMFYVLGLIYGQGIINTFYIQNCFDNTTIEIRPVLRTFGIKAINYWIGQFLGNYCLFLFTVPLFTIFLFNFNIVALVSNYSLILSIFLTFGSATVSSFFVYGVLFQKRSRNCYFVFFTIAAIYIPFGLYMNAMQNECRYWSIISVPISIFPIVQLMISHAQIIFDYYNMQPFCPGFLTPNQVPFLFLIQTFAYLFLAIFLQQRKFSSRILKENKEASTLQVNIEDERFHVGRVLQERNLLNAHYGKELSTEANMQVKHMIIKYKSQPFPAVADVSFRVKQNQIFGLLGPNGAGKTSTFQALLQNQPVKLGSSYLLDSQISEDLEDVNIESGLCAQNDILWERLNVLEHLQIYADIKGLKGRRKKEQIFYLTRSLNLSEYLLVDSQNLSGGNKRKLCVAISMLGSPKLNFHDQPTTGVDPVSRRNLWSLFKQTSQIKSRSLLLTTQKMDEAELLCDRMAIMVNGQIRYLGTPSQLRDELTKGYYITLQKCEANQEVDLLSIITEQNIEGIQVEIETEKDLVLSIGREGLKLGKILEILNLLKDEHKIEEWVLTRSNLDEVFMRVAREQRNGQ